MNISTAGFDWISLLFIVIAGIIGIAKSSKEQKRKKAVSRPYRPETVEEEIEEEYTIPTVDKSEDVPAYAADFYRKPLPEKGVSMSGNLSFSPMETEEEIEYEEREHFDLRQAIISSEILKRPQF